MSAARPVIAIVDDDEVFVEMMVDFLADEGFATASCRQAADAAALLRSERPALVVVDVRMERPDAGLDVIVALRRDPDMALAALPVIVCTADHAIVQQHAGLLDQLDVTVQRKPFNLDELLALVHGLLQRGPTAPTARTSFDTLQDF